MALQKLWSGGMITAKASQKAPRVRTSERLHIGYVPLVDAAPLVAAAEWGCYRDVGLDVVLSREIGWGTIRDKLIFGELDAVQMPAPMAFAISAGLGCAPAAVSTAWVLNRQGNAITLSNELRKQGVTDGRSLCQLVRSQAPRRLTLAVVAKYSMHMVMLNRWLVAAGIRPQRDVRIVVIPPPQMVRSLTDGLIDGFCVGEPWNSAAVQTGAGWCPATSVDTFPNHIEKALVTRAELLAAKPEIHTALLQALRIASARCESPEGRAELVPMLSQSNRLNVSEAVLKPSLTSQFDNGQPGQRPAERFHQFHGPELHRPDRESIHQMWEGMIDCGLVPECPPTLEDLLPRIYRADLYDSMISTKNKNRTKEKTVSTLAA